MQFQHGTFQIGSNGSLTLNPYSVDGRQLLSQPCEFQNSILTRYNQTEFFQRYDPYIDPYHNIMRLDLYQFDGSPANPMYLVYKPPQMLPTQTLNPTTTSSAPGSTSTANSKLRRSLSGLPGSIDDSTISRRKHAVNADRWWWIGVGMTAIGGVGYFCF
ncbi:Reversal of tor2 lethality [Loxospora ochrophaea]|nr:Reversal of tor2 lethality [Loxospora ochrophaea]